jgi:hypothetical protein
MSGKQGDRYEPGMLSLAREVVKDGLRSGDKHIGESIWAEFLLWYNRNRTNSFPKRVMIVRRTKEHDDD